MVTAKRFKKKGLRLASKLLGSMNFSAELQEKISEDLLARHWDEMLGAFLAKKTRPGRIDRNRLTVVVESSPLANQLHYMQADLIKKIKETLPRTTITSIRFKVDPDLEQKILDDHAERSDLPKYRKPKRKVRLRTKLSETLKEALQNISDEETRETIRRLMIYNRSYHPDR